MNPEILRIVLVFIGFSNLAIAWNSKQELVRFFSRLIGMLAITTGTHV